MEAWTAGSECGMLKPLRSSSLAVVFEYEYRQCGASAVGERRFQFDAIVATTHGHWKFRGNGGWSDIDSDSVVLGSAGESYACRHDSRGQDKKLAVCLRPGAVDAGVRLFERQVVPSRRSLTLLRNVLGAQTTDEFDSIVFTLFSEAVVNSARSPAIKPASLRMQRAKRFIEMHAFEPLQLRDIASELGLSPFTTLRQFRAYTGKTPHGYLLELRLEQAKRLLTTSAMPVESIAKMVGFHDIAYFSRFFKRRTGVPPSSYRTDLKMIS